MEQNKDKSQVEQEVKQDQTEQAPTKVAAEEEQPPATEEPEIQEKAEADNKKSDKTSSEQEAKEEQAENDETKLQEELSKAKQELDTAKDQLVRLQAEFINFRKRKEKEMLDTVRFANEELIKNLLPIVDNFDRTLDAIEKTDNMSAIKDGIKIVGHSMKHQLERIGVKPIDCINKDFDAQFHDAVTSVPVEEEEKKGKVIDEVEKGYMLKDKVIRYSKVIVGE